MSDTIGNTATLPAKDSGADTAQTSAAATSGRLRGGRRGLPYLPALDGVRAIAVLAVMFYHADVPWLPGGFLGVDIFFVLSGFLITSLILTELERSDRLSFRNFYVRRARRLLPALVLVLAGAAFIGAFLATDAAAALRRDIPAALTYVTNWAYVFADLSYFDVIGRPPLLQHLWSLAVEEQFYLIWPAVVYLAFRRGQRSSVRSPRETVRRWAMIGALGSTGIMIVLSLMGGYPEPNDGSRAYFGTDAHAMGLLIGAALATFWLPQYVRKTVNSAKYVINATAAVTLLLLLWIMMGTHSTSAWLYRGGFLVFAVLVAIMLVAVTHPESALGRVLGRQPFRYIGERSYGLYLWHWPVFLILRPGLDVPLEGFANLVLRFAVTFGLAELSYRYVETPIRRDGFKATWARVRQALTPSANPRARTYLAVVAALGLLATLMTFRVVTIPEEQADYLGGATEVSALPAEPADPHKVDPVTGEIVANDQAAALKPGVLAIGESVMLGARTGLSDRIKSTSVDAAVGRQAADVLSRIRQLKAAGAFRETVVLHVGSNGYVTKEQMDSIMKEFSGVPRLVLVNVSVPRVWQDPNNALIEEAVRTHPNTILADWHTVGSEGSGLKVSDGVHLTTKGIKDYSKTIKDAIVSITEAQEALAPPVEEGSEESQPTE